MSVVVRFILMFFPDFGCHSRAATRLMGCSLLMLLFLLDSVSLMKTWMYDMLLQVIK